MSQPRCPGTPHKAVLGAHQSLSQNPLKPQGAPPQASKPCFSPQQQSPRQTRTGITTCKVAAQQLRLLGLDHWLSRLWMADQSNFGGTTACDLGNWLLQYGVDSSLYGSGTAKSLDALLGEVLKGESALTVVNGKPLRMLRVLSLLIRNERGEVLIEEKQIRPNGSVRCRGLPLSEKLLGAEDWESAIPRAIREELGSVLNGSPKIKILKDTYAKDIEYSTSVSYPMLESQYECHRVEVRIEDLPKENFVTHEPQGDGVLELHWEWRACWKRD